MYRQTAIRQNKSKPECSSQNAVKITTMHSSKGLEYPIVILPNLDLDYNKSPEEHEIKIPLKMIPSL